MITQKQIDTRDEYIKLLNAEVAHWAGFLHAHRCFSEHAEQGRILRKAIADADWESYKTRISGADKEAFDAEIIAMAFDKDNRTSDDEICSEKKG